MNSDNTTMSGLNEFFVVTTSLLDSITLDTYLNREKMSVIRYGIDGLQNTQTIIKKDNIFSNAELMNCIVCSVMSVPQGYEHTKVCGSYCAYELEMNPVKEVREEELEEIPSTDEEKNKMWITQEINLQKKFITKIKRMSVKKISKVNKAIKISEHMKNIEELMELDC